MQIEDRKENLTLPNEKGGGTHLLSPPPALAALVANPRRPAYYRRRAGWKGAAALERTPPRLELGAQGTVAQSA